MSKTGQNNFPFVFNSNAGYLKDIISSLLQKYQITNKTYIIDKDNHKFYLSDYLLCNSSLLCNSGINANSSKELLKNLENLKNGAFTVFFKPTYELMELSKNKGLIPLQKDYRNNLRIENKVHLYRDTPGDLKDLYPPSIVSVFSDLDFHSAEACLSLPFIIQFSSGYSGKTTFIVQDIDNFNRLKRKFRNIIIKASRIIDGITYTLNGFNFDSYFSYSEPFIQISKKQDLNPNPLGSCGNIFGVPIDRKAIFSDFMKRVKALLDYYNFSGFFGIDFIMNKRPYLIEINPRFTTSVSIQSEHSILCGKIPPFLYEMTRLLLNTKGLNAVRDGLDCLKNAEQSLLKTKATPNITQMIQYNIMSSDYIQNSDMKTGTYTNYDGKISNKSTNVLFSQLKERDFIMFAPVPGRIISAGNEISRIIYNTPAFDPNYVTGLSKRLFFHNSAGKSETFTA